MIRLLLLLLLLYPVSFISAQNVGINTTNPQEQLHLRSDSTKLAIRFDNKKSAQAGFDYASVTATPSAAQAIEINSLWQDWTDLNHTNLVNSDNTRMNGPQLEIYPDVSNGLKVVFSPGSAIPSTAQITDITLHAEWRRTGTFAGPLTFLLSLHKNSNNQPLVSFGIQTVTTSTDLTNAIAIQSLISPVTPDMVNLSDIFILFGGITSLVQGQSRIEIDRLWLEIEYKVPSSNNSNVFWSAGVKEGEFKITNSSNLNSNPYLTIDESGVTSLRGLQITKNAGAGKVLMSNDSGRAFWANIPQPETDVLWINKQDTAYYADGPVQIHNVTGNPALIFDKGASKINNGINLIETNNRLLNVIVDANNDQTNEQFNIYRDSTEFLAQGPAVRFSLDSNDSWINGRGNVGIGKTTPTEKLDINGAVRLGNTSNLSPQAGTVRYNETNQLFEGFDGAQWRSLTSQFEKAGTLVRSIGNHGTDDFVFGADALPPATAVTDTLLFFDKSKGAFRVGRMQVPLNYWAPDNIGLASFSMGTNNQASGGSSAAFGYATTASGTSAASFGLATRATGNYSFAAGSSSEATGTDAVSLGSGTYAGANAAIATGYQTTATGMHSTSIGTLTKASGYSTTSIGYYTIAKGFSSTAIGMFNDSILLADEAVVSPTTPLFIIGNGDNNSARSNALVVNKNGRMGLGLNLPGHPIHHSNGARLTAAGIWTDASDRRFKSAIKPIHYGLKEVLLLQPSTYTVNATGEQHIGFIAQDLKTIIPEVVNGTEGDMKKGETLGVAYGNMVALLTKAIQEQQEMILAQKRQIEEMQKQIMELTEKNK